MDELQEAIKRYIDLSDKYKSYIIQFLGTGWVEGKFNAPQKALNREEFKKIRIMKRELDTAHKEYLSFFRGKMKENK